MVPYASTKPDSDIERSNVSCRYFIDILEQAFEALGGKTWLEEHANEEKQEENLDDFILANSFTLLGVSTDAVDEQESGAASDEQKVRLSDFPMLNHAVCYQTLWYIVTYTW